LEVHNLHKKRKIEGKKEIDDERIQMRKKGDGKGGMRKGGRGLLQSESGRVRRGGKKLVLAFHQSSLIFGR